MELNVLTRNVTNKMDFTPCLLLDRGKNAKHKVKLKEEKEDEMKPQSLKSLQSFISVYSVVEKPFILSPSSSFMGSGSDGGSISDETSSNILYGPGDNRYLELASEEFRIQVHNRLEEERSLLADYKTAFPEFSNRFSSDRIAREKLKRQERDYIQQLSLNAGTNLTETKDNHTTNQNSKLRDRRKERQYITSYNNLYYHTQVKSINQTEKDKLSKLHERKEIPKSSYPTLYCRHPTCGMSFHFASDVIIHERLHSNDPVFNRVYHPPLRLRIEDTLNRSPVSKDGKSDRTLR